MAHVKHALKVYVCDYEMPTVAEMAHRAELGGRSHVRTDPRDRMANLRRDQLVGQVGMYAFHKYYLNGGLPFPQTYMSMRWAQNRAPWTGDKGCDVMGAPLDVKTSLIRGGRSFDSYALAVRPPELHSNVVYVRALVESNASGGDLVALAPATVWLLGWAHASELPRELQSAGEVYEGSHVLPVRDLHPMMPIPYNWLGN